ncbi:branched-chain amino acid transport system permease protein [Dongia mobilis]|uniref:Branched-chain amino acid transport system permease protein n=1 Tax=Dongia mobilis TaxID=578943 RepID=A0A4R6X1S7_9PROT|nr:branched-chain amino acid ABC transporter permease [Dongia mobilis]TDQ84418.1 branched-chain amino acid transport system permease protein [Dongia mobilis]
MDITLYGLMMYGLALLTMMAIYGVLCLALNLQWGFAGLFNAGIAGFFAVGAYATAILTAPESPNHLGGYGWPPLLALPVAMALAGIIAWPVGRICLGLKGDYLAMATIGIAEIIRLVFKNESWLANGTMGISTVPRPFESLGQPWGNLAFLALVLAIVIALYFSAERAWVSPWGRAMRAIRDNETAAAAIGKDVVRFRLEAFVLGAMVMGLGGGLSAMYFKFIGATATEPLLTTFLVWVMLIIGGSGNNKGALLGAALVWLIWSGTELFTNRLPAEWITRSSYIRTLLIGVLLIVVLQRFAKGVLPERPPKRID